MFSSVELALLQRAMMGFKPEPKKKIIRQDRLTKFNDGTMKGSDLNVAELKELCKERGLLCSGNKTQLMERLALHEQNPDGASLPKKRKRASAAEENEIKKARMAKMSDDPPTGEWAHKCIKRWNLLAPYDIDITEAQWNAYYDERSAVEAKNDEDSDGDDYNMSSEISKLSRAAVRKVVAGIRHLDPLQALLTTLEKGLYVLKDYVLEEDVGEPRTVETQVRLYSPIGNGCSVQFQYDYHCRPRYSYVEYFVSLYGAVRTPAVLGKVQSDLTRSGTKLFNKSHNDRKRKFDRSIPSAMSLKNYEDALFGTSGKVSALKMLKVVCSAAGCDAHGESEFSDWVVRIAVRDKKMKLNENEFSEDEEDYKDDDANSNCTEPASEHSDSDNESGGFGGGLFGFPRFQF